MNQAPAVISHPVKPAPPLRIACRVDNPDKVSARASPSIPMGRTCPPRGSPKFTTSPISGGSFAGIGDNSAEASYYTWVDQHNTLGLGNDARYCRKTQTTMNRRNINQVSGKHRNGHCEVDLIYSGLVGCVPFGDFFNRIAPHLPFAIPAGIGSTGGLPPLRQSRRERLNRAGPKVCPTVRCAAL